VGVAEKRFCEYKNLWSAAFKRHVTVSFFRAYAMLHYHVHAHWESVPFLGGGSSVEKVHHKNFKILTV
jgi:hypothetical protein